MTQSHRTIELFSMDRCTHIPDTTNGTSIFTYIEVVEKGVNVCKYASPMECLGMYFFGSGPM